MQNEFFSLKFFLNEFKQKGDAPLYRDLITEEANELMLAVDEEDKYKEAADLVYVVMGLFASLDLDPVKLDRTFNHVHYSNLTKRSRTAAEVQTWINSRDLDAKVDVTPSGLYFAVDNKTGKVLKGPNYQPPNII